jgi:hypothetical protein
MVIPAAQLREYGALGLAPPSLLLRGVFQLRLLGEATLGQACADGQGGFCRSDAPQTLCRSPHQGQFSTRLQLYFPEAEIENGSSWVSGFLSMILMAAPRVHWTVYFADSQQQIGPDRDCEPGFRFKCE